LVLCHPTIIIFKLYYFFADTKCNIAQLGIHLRIIMMKIKNIYLGSLTSLAVMASSLAFAEEMVTAPTLDGGITASIGTFYAVPSSDNNEYFIANNDTHSTFSNAQADYNWGLDASLGYIFENTANGIELSYRTINADGSNNAQDGTIPGIDASWDNVRDDIKYDLNNFDLMISQFMDLGTHMQMRFSGGLSYVELEQKENVYGTFTNVSDETTNFAGKEKSKFTGWGPRLAMDARYDFGEDLAGFGIVGGASVAYLLGSSKITASTTQTSEDGRGNFNNSLSDDINNRAVTNLRGNLGVDYVYFFDNDEKSTLGLELGYLVDFYDDAIVNTAMDSDGPVDIIGGAGTASTTNSPVTFSGPYLSLKGAF
jgi:hypothetical protein